MLSLLERQDPVVFGHGGLTSPVNAVAAAVFIATRREVDWDSLSQVALEVAMEHSQDLLKNKESVRLDCPENITRLCREYGFIFNVDEPGEPVRFRRIPKEER